MLCCVVEVAWNLGLEDKTKFKMIALQESLLLDATSCTIKLCCIVYICLSQLITTSSLFPVV